jgi:metal-responsive CopG/Arc/MetJ family transcriptional regulator
MPDDLFAQAERLAKQLRKSRSELYREAIVEYVARHDPDEVTTTMNDVLAEVGDASDRSVVGIGRRRLRATTW